MIRRLLLALLLISAVAAVPATASAATVGISDQDAASFESPLFTGLKLKVARYIAPYDVMRDPVQLARMDAWIRNGRAAKQRLLLSFEHSRVAGREHVVPTNAQFRREMLAFKAAYGRDVEAISPWNEVNVCQKNGRVEGQPPRICRLTTGPKIVAGYYSVARSVFKGKKIVALDILDNKNVRAAVKYIEKFRRIAKPRPKIWGFHNYSDTNRGSMSRTRAMIKAVDDRKAEIWLTETGGQLKLRHRVFGETEAAKALRCMFRISRSFKQIKRLYIYQFAGAADHAEFDAGLVDATLTHPRKGYAVVKKRQAGPCRP